MKEFHRIFQGQDVLRKVPVQIVHHRRQRGGFSAARGAGNQDQSAGQTAQFFHSFRQIQVRGKDVTAPFQRTSSQRRTAHRVEKVEAEPEAAKSPGGVFGSRKKIFRFTRLPEDLTAEGIDDAPRNGRAAGGTKGAVFPQDRYL